MARTKFKWDSWLGKLNVILSWNPFAAKEQIQV